MIPMRRGIRIGLATLLVVGCTQPRRGDDTGVDSALLNKRADRLDSALTDSTARHSTDPIARWAMPNGLREISGLALAGNGRVFAHGDQKAKVYELDYRGGAVVKEFSLGDPAVAGDFEGITMVGDTLVLLASNGILYEFPEGKNKQAVEYTSEDTRLGTDCEFEGIAYEAKTDEFLLACKVVHLKALKGSLVIYRWPRVPTADDPKRENTGYLAIPQAEAIGGNKWKSLHPSDITIDPISGNYLLLAGREEAILEITPEGKVLFSRPLPKGHPQPEGIALTREGILLIADESKKLAATVTLYRFPR